MKRNPNLILAGVLLAVCIIAMPTIISANDCSFYIDSQVVYWPGYGYICAGSDPGGCTECRDGAGGACVRPGMSFCRPTPLPP